MVEIYCKLIINGRRTFEQVPTNFKDEVEARLKELGYNTEGERISTEEQLCYILLFIY